VSHQSCSDTVIGFFAAEGGIASFRSESWTSNPVRLKRAGVPVEYRAARTKPEIALAEIDRVMTAGMRFGCVLADAGYGNTE
jgi:SRSO17 transposase